MNNAKWTWFAIGYQCGFAYVIALMITQFGNIFYDGGKNVNILGVIVSIVLLVGIIYQLFKPYKEAGKFSGNVKVAEKEKALK